MADKSEGLGPLSAVMVNFINLTGLWGAQAFGQTFWVLLKMFLSDYHIRISQLTDPSRWPSPVRVVFSCPLIEPEENRG